MIEVQNVTKYYGRICALDSISFGVKSGGISRFTYVLATIFCGSAILISATWN